MCVVHIVRSRFEWFQCATVNTSHSPNLITHVTCSTLSSCSEEGESFSGVCDKSSNKSGNESGNLRCNWVKTHCSHCRFIVVAKLKDLSCRVTITVQVNLARRHFLTTTFWLPPPPQAPSSLTTCTIPLILPQNGWLLSFFCLPMLSWEIRAIRLGVLLTCRQRRESGQLGVAQSYLYLSLMFSLTSAVSLDVVRLLYHSIRGKDQT